MDVKFILAMTDKEMEVAFFVMCEQEEQFLFPSVSEKFKKRIHQSVIVLDLKGVNAFKIYSKLKRVFKISNRLASDYYPETLYKMIILNAGKIYNQCFFERSSNNFIWILYSFVCYNY